MNLQNIQFNSRYARYRPSTFKLQRIMQSKRNQSFAWLSLTILTVCFFLIVAIRPTLVTIAKLNKEIKDLSEANQKLQTKINTIVEAQNEFAKYSDDLFLLDQAVPDNSDFPRLVYFLEQSTVNEGVELKSLNLDRIGVAEKTAKEATASAIQTLNFSITASGDYLRLVNLLQDLESSRRILRLGSTSFTLTKKDKDSAYELLVAFSGQSSFGKAPAEKHNQ